MTTITIREDVNLEKLDFESLDDLRAYLTELDMRSLETDELFEELRRRDEYAQQNPSSLRTWEQVTQRLDALR